MHNALVMGLDSDNDSTDSENPLVRVIFCHPTQVSMRICDHFLNDKCRFGAQCKYSHGHAVRMDDLHEYVECDYKYA